jgi:chromosome segregation ATPase
MEIAVTERTHEQALSYIIELEAELSELRFELEEATKERDAWSDLVDEQEEELSDLQCRVTELEVIEPVSDRAASIRGALDAIPAELKRDPRYQYDFQTISQFVQELGG